jgi:predicted ferric reductase
MRSWPEDFADFVTERDWEVSNTVSKSHDWISLWATLFVVFGYLLLKMFGCSAKLGGFPFSPATPHWLDDWTYNMYSSLRGMTHGECFFFLSYLIFVTAYIWESIDNQLEVNRSTIFTSGHMIQLHLTIAIMPVYRNSIFLPLMDVTYERSVKFHRWCTRLVVVFAALHFGLMYTYRLQKWQQLFEVRGTPEGSGVLFGTLCFFCMCLMALFSSEWIRRTNYEFFKHSHVFLFILVTGFSIAHNTDMFYWRGPITLWIVDRAFRFYKGRYVPVDVTAHGFKICSAANGSRTTVLTCQRQGDYIAGQYCFLNFPQISGLRWHPFTISSGPNTTNTLTFHMKDMGAGTFTNKLATVVERGMSHTQVRVDGPYGMCSFDPKKVPHVLLIGGGIGVTYVLSHLHDLVSSAEEQIKSLTFVWITRDKYDLEVLCPDLATRQPILQMCKKGKLKFIIYNTRGTSDKLSQNPSSDMVELNEIKMHTPASPQGKDASAGGTIRIIIEGNGYKLASQADFDSLKARLNVPTLLDIDGDIVAGFDALTHQTEYFISNPPAGAGLALAGKGEEKLAAKKSENKLRIEEYDGRRPNIEAIVSTYSGVGSNYGILACGPVSLMDAVRTVAVKNQVWYHQECFAY